MNPNRRVLVIGLDAATFDLIDPWTAEGHLPNLARLMSTGSRGRLASTLQPVTAPAWVTFMTGVNQGKHGLYDFVRRRPNGYDLEVTNASHIGAPTIFEIASRAGRHVVSVNVPYTFPPSQINGVMIGGPFTTTVTRDLVSPPTYFDVLKTVVPDYFILPDYDPRAADPLAAFASKLLEEVELRERLGLYLMQTEPWDLFAIVFMATDEAQHSYWSCIDAPSDSPLSPYRHVIRDVYQRIDQAIGAFLAQVAADGSQRETVVVILSDHGAGALRWMINLNQWLAEAGYLSFRTDHSPLMWLRAYGAKRLAYLYRRYAPARVREFIRTRLGARGFSRVKGELESAVLTSMVNWKQTHAYSIGAGGNIFINLQGREPAGIVQPETEYERLRHAIAQTLLTLCDPETGRPVIRRVYRREELYHGPFASQSPDLVIQWSDYAYWGRGVYGGQAPVFEAQRHFDFSDQPLSGAHRPDGILIIQGPGIKSAVQVEGAALQDLAPTILGILGIPIPEYMDGVVLRHAFVNDAIETSSESLTQPESGREFDYTPEEAAQITQHLRDLGYL
jgi:predicted AlkP superfamily phosphohydrolase/phosphomutase